MHLTLTCHLSTRRGLGIEKLPSYGHEIFWFKAIISKAPLEAKSWSYFHRQCGKNTKLFFPSREVGPFLPTILSEAHLIEIDR